MSLPQISDVCSALSKLKNGSRCWFWYCPDLPSDSPKLLLKPFEEANGMKHLKDWAQSLPVDPRDKTYFGVMNVDSQSKCHFGGANIDRRMLRSLAIWTHEQTTKYPDLALLRNAQINLVDINGKLTETYDMQSLWLGLPERFFNGSLPFSAAALESMAPGDSAFVWMSAHGPNGNPHLCISLQKNDAEAKQLLKWYKFLDAPSPRLGQPFVVP